MEQILELKKKIETNNLKIDHLHKINSKLEQIELTKQEKLNEIIKKFEEEWENSEEYKKMEKNRKTILNYFQENENLKNEISHTIFESKKDHYKTILELWCSMREYKYEKFINFYLFCKKEWKVKESLKDDMIRLTSGYFGKSIFGYEEHQFKIEVFEALLGLISKRKDKSSDLIEIIRSIWGDFYLHLYEYVEKPENFKIINLYVWGTEDYSNSEDYKEYAKKEEEEYYNMMLLEEEEEEYSEDKYEKFKEEEEGKEQ